METTPQVRLVLMACFFCWQTVVERDIPGNLMWRTQKSLPIPRAPRLSSASVFLTFDGRRRLLEHCFATRVKGSPAGKLAGSPQRLEAAAKGEDRTWQTEVK